jgi:hypothetical protein
MSVTVQVWNSSEIPLRCYQANNKKSAFSSDYAAEEYCKSSSTALKKRVGFLAYIIQTGKEEL